VKLRAPVREAVGPMRPCARQWAAADPGAGPHSPCAPVRGRGRGVGDGRRGLWRPRTSYCYTAPLGRLGWARTECPPAGVASPTAPHNQNPQSKMQRCTPRAALPMHANRRSGGIRQPRAHPPPPPPRIHACPRVPHSLTARRCITPPFHDQSVRLWTRTSSIHQQQHPAAC
jgi:hypothetical protein